MRAVPQAFLILAALPLSRCTCGEQLRQLNPVIDVHPRRLDFGARVVGVLATEPLQVGNTGTGRLALKLAIEPANVGFTIESGVAEVRAGDAQQLRVGFAPLTRNAVQAELVLSSNDDATPSLRVPLSGSGGPPRLSVEPTVVNFGGVNEGSHSERAVTLTNTGLDVMTQLRVAWECCDFFAAGGVPTQLAAGASAVVTIAFDATTVTAAAEQDDGFAHDTLHVTHADGAVDVQVQAAVNLAPVAIAVEGVSRLTQVKSSVQRPLTIDGRASFDPDGDAITFAWALAARPATSSATLFALGDDQVRLVPDVVGSYDVVLRVTDVFGAFAEAHVAVLPRDLVVLLTWATADSAACNDVSDATCAQLPLDQQHAQCCGQSDLDLHVLKPGGALGDYGVCPVGCQQAFCSETDDSHADSCRQLGSDCAWANRSPEWGASGRVDDPHLDIDDVRGAGPEISSLDEPEDGAYFAVVHYCNDRIGEPTDATLEIYVEGVLAHTSGPQRVEQGDAWTAATLLRADAAWTFVAPANVVTAAPVGLCGG